MTKIKAADAQPGMVLKDDLVLPNGRLLIRAGTLLDFEHLRAVRLWGVRELDIRDPELSTVGADETFRPDSTPALASDPDLLQKRFSKCDLNHSVIQELIRVARSSPGVPGFSPTHSFFHPHQDSWAHLDLQMEKGGEITAGPKDDPESLINPDMELVSLPDIFYQVLGVINNARSSAFQVAEVISKDPNLSAKLLKIVNSAFYGFPKQVDTISRAVAIVGSDQLSTLTLGTSVFSLFQDIPPDLMNMRWFWEHSLACGITSRVIASYKNLPNLEQLFISGLIHDLGKLVLFKNRPQQAAAALNQAFHYNLFHYEAEADRLGFDHALAGKALARKWKLPLSLEQAIAGHHAPLTFPPSVDAAVVFMADNLVNALGYGTSGEHWVSPHVIEVWDYLRLPEGILEHLVALVNRQLEDTFHLFFP